MEFSWLFITLFIFPFLMLMKVWKKQTPKNLPPGPPKLPLIGNLHQLTKGNTFPHRRLSELAKVHGPMMHLKLGEVSTVIISSAEMAKEVMKTHDAVFCSRPSLMLGRELFYGSSDIGLAPYGEYWRQVRKISVLELFTAKRVQSFRPIREEEVAELIESLRSQAGSSVVNLSNKLFGLTFNITARATFNKKGKDQEEFRALTEDIFKLSSGFSVVDVFPSIEFLYSIFGMKRKFKELVRQSNRILDPIIDEHKSKKINQGIGEEEDLVDVLLKFHKDNVKTPQQFSLTTDNIKTIILELFSAGTETTSTALEWAISKLLKNPKEMKKAQDEVRRVYQGETAIDEKKLHELNYLKLVIKETLRLHPPAPLLVPRESMDKCQINSYDIPSKTRVLVNAWAIGRDPEFWPEPERFNPERFDNNSSVDYKGTDFELIPFGAGRRMCPGVALGMANVELPLAMLLYHFDWKLPCNLSPEYLDMNEAFGLTVRRKNDLQVIPIPYPY